MVADQMTRASARMAQGHGPLVVASRERRFHSASVLEGMTPSIWLKDFRLVYRAGGVDDDYFIIQYLPIYVGEHVQAWLEFLLPYIIRNWADLKRIFIGNFQGTYVCPGNSWDLKN